MNRRDFLYSNSVLLAGTSLSAEKMPYLSNKDSKVFNLLKTWCDRMLELQIWEVPHPSAYGGILSPADARIRGRVWEALYPMMCLYRRTGEERYLRSARGLQKWSKNVLIYNGAYMNEPYTNEWLGTTVFGMIALGMAVKFHGDLLSDKERAEWLKPMPAATEWIEEHLTFELKRSNINYPMSAILALHLAGTLLEEEKWIKRAAYEAELAYEFFSSPNELIVGEGNPWLQKSPRNCYHIDLGYNVEESLPNLLFYALESKNEKLKAQVYGSAEQHLKFLLPDGGWDNSWGTRRDKWTYWGSRTSDGSYPLYAHFAEKNEDFANAAALNLKLLEACTYEGFLTGGPDYEEAGIAVSLHHTFCHAKALAFAIDYEMPLEIEAKGTVPREREKGLIKVPEINAYRLQHEPWTATFTFNDALYKANATASGGVLSVLYLKNWGMLLGSSTEVYHRYERDNMHPARVLENLGVLTPQLYAYQDEKIYRQAFDFQAEMEEISRKDTALKFKVKGQLCAEYGKRQKESPAFEMEYEFLADQMRIRYRILSWEEGMNAVFSCPILANKSVKVKAMDGQNIELIKDEKRINIRSDVAFENLNTEQRIFHFSPGFLALPLKINWSGSGWQEIEIRLS
ncbi:MAG: hypothetical protein AAF849_20630 [Bacteroidota bacterium]